MTPGVGVAEGATWGRFWGAGGGPPSVRAAGRRVVEHFSDNITNKIDAKGRVSVPAKFRQVLTAQGAQTVFLKRADHQKAIEGFGPLLRRQLDERLAQLDPLSLEYDALANSVFGRSTELSWDSEGRIKLPEEFLKFAGISDQVVFVGLGRKFQIWAPAEHAAWEKRADEIVAGSAGLLAARPGGGVQ